MGNIVTDNIVTGNIVKGNTVTGNIVTNNIQCCIKFFLNDLSEGMMAYNTYLLSIGVLSSAKTE